MNNYYILLDTDSIRLKNTYPIDSIIVCKQSVCDSTSKSIKIDTDLVTDLNCIHIWSV